MATQDIFKNRIIGYATKPADQFLFNELNYRKHPQRQRDAVNGSLRELGWIAAVIENVRTGRLVDGHERVWQALQKNEDVPYLQVDLSEEEERLALAIFDPLTNMAETDAEILDELLQDVNTGEAALQSLLAELATEAGLYVGDEPPLADPGAQISQVDELQEKWQVQPGDLWQLGEHRIICGDCTDADTVARLMGTEKADLVASDPPYGVDYEGKTADALVIQNDSAEGLPALLSASFGVAFDICKPGGVWYIAAPPGPQFYEFATVLLSLGVWRQTLAWVKNTMVLGHSDYHYKHEVIFYGWKPGGTHLSPPDRAQVSVWEFDKPSASRLHPTMKPVDLYAKAIGNSTRLGDIVYEPFMGSGTTLIACEQLGRKCRAVEISPAYCAVALQRWADMTGIEPLRAD